MYCIVFCIIGMNVQIDPISGDLLHILVLVHINVQYSVLWKNEGIVFILIYRL